MSENKNLVPKRRFKEFENADAWKQRELGNVADVTKLAGFEFTEYVIYSDVGEIIALRGLNVKNGKIILEDVKYIDDSDFSKLNRSKLFKDDILFTYVGTVGDLAVVPEDNKYYLAPNVARIRLKDGVNSIFVSQMMNDKNYYNKVIFPLIATSSQPALSMENVRKFTLLLPNIEEQSKIGEFFKNLDQTIAFQQRKLEKMKLMKSAYLSEMFPAEGERKPKRRFPGFTDDWEQRELGDVADVTTGFPFKNVDFIDEGIFLVITNSNIQQEFHYVDNSLGNRISDITDELKSRYLLDVGDILVTMDGTVGRTAKVIENNQILAQRVGRLRAKEDKEFLYHWLNTGSFFEKMTKISHGGTIKHISLLEISEFFAYYPKNIEEQLKIGQFFKNLNQTITFQQQKLEKLQNIKKAYLNEMFI